MRVKRANGLTDKQERFCQERAKGKTQVEAYREAYNANGTSQTDRTCAYKIGQTEKVKARIQELNNQIEAGALLTLEQIRADLAGIASDTDKPDGVRLKAFDQLTRMQGGYQDNAYITHTGNIALSQLSDTIADLLE